jgi:Ca2+-transporting ATPase
MGWPVVLFPLHIAFLEVVIDPACSMVFENEPPEEDLMQQAPRNVQAPLFGGRTMVWAVLQGLGLLALLVGAHLWSSAHLQEAAARAFVFTALVAGNLALIFSNRSRSNPVWASLRTPNRTLWVVVAATLLMLALALYVPWLSGLFRFAPLAAGEVAMAAAWGASALVWFELLRRAHQGRPTQDASGMR